MNRGKRKTSERQFAVRAMVALAAVIMAGGMWVINGMQDGVSSSIVDIPIIQEAAHGGGKTTTNAPTNKQGAPAPKASSTAPKASTAPAADWKTFKSASGKLQFHYPDNWSVASTPSPASDQQPAFDTIVATSPDGALRVTIANGVLQHEGPYPAHSSVPAKERINMLGKTYDFTYVQTVGDGADKPYDVFAVVLQTSQSTRAIWPTSPDLGEYQGQPRYIAVSIGNKNPNPSYQAMKSSPYFVTAKQIVQSIVAR